MYAVRLWSIRHAGFWERFYQRFERAYVAAGPMLKRVGFARLEGPAALIERNVKGLLSSTGMSCPMNCPKQMRNGPCGGVRADGHCEVKPEMRCVWVQAWEGSRRMGEGDRIVTLQPPVDHRRKGSSSWLAVIREHLG